MKNFILLICLLASIGHSYALPLGLSDSTQISLITCSPGKEVYAKFGHTAIRLKDPANNIDQVFNYGTFDFNTKNFYAKFIKGETDYLLSDYSFEYFLPEYINRNSSVWEQVLNLNPDEKKELINLLIINSEPQNRTYRYNFVFDNCATRPRDIILKALNGTVSYSPSEEHTFREWVGKYVGEDTWLKFGIDMIFGADADNIASQTESMFLPEVLMNEFQEAEINNNGINSYPLIKNYKILAQKEKEEANSLPVLCKPIGISICLLLLGILFCFKKKKFGYVFKSFDTLLYISVGLIGCIAFYLTFFSIHPLVKNNFNLLWLNPLFLVVGIIHWIKPLRTVTFYIQIVNALLLLASLVVFTLFLQAMNTAFLPLIVLLLIRVINYLRIRIKKKFKNRMS